jgi:hypothetical protein
MTYLDLPAVLGFPAEPWKFAGVRRIVWFQNPLAALYTIHLLLAHTLNLAADKDDLPVRVAFPTRLGELALCWVSGRGNVFKNRTWQSFFRWLESAERAPERLRENLDQQRHRAAVRQLIADKQTRPIALSPLPYNHELGPTGTAPKTFGHVGAGLRNNVVSTNVNKSRKHAFLKLAKMFETGGAFTDVGDGNLVWKPDARLGFHLVGHRPLFPYPDVVDANRRFDAERKQYGRIKANGGKRRPVGRPRTISTDKEKRALELLAAGWGKKRIAKELGTGVSFVQRVKGTANRPG